MTTPRALPVVELPLTQALTEQALSLQPPPIDVSIGPPKGSFKLCMMEVNTSPMSAYEYPLAPSTCEVQGPSNTVFSTSPSQSLPTNPVKAQGPLRCDLHEVVVTSNDDKSVFDNVKDLRGIYEKGGGKSNGRVKTFKMFGLETKSSLEL